MKSLFIKSAVVCMIVTSTSLVLANAFLSQNQQKLTSSALKLLESQLETVSYEGDIHPGENMKGLFVDIKNYENELLEKLQNGESIENLKSPVRSIHDECHMIESTQTAQCQLIVSYKPLGETALTFKVQVGEDFEVTAVEKNTVSVSRGD